MRSIIFLLQTVFVCQINLQGQENLDSVPEIPKKLEILRVVDEQAEFPGGMTALMQYLGENINYPEEAEENGIMGRVILRFVVGIDGSISDVVIMKDIGGGCGAEAARVVKLMPNWQPGRYRGENVRVYYTLPVTFKLAQVEPIILEKKKKRRN